MFVRAGWHGTETSLAVEEGVFARASRVDDLCFLHGQWAGCCRPKQLGFLCFIGEQESFDFFPPLFEIFICRLHLEYKL